MWVTLDMERWQSGRSRTLGKRVRCKSLRGFESLSLRHLGQYTLVRADMRVLKLSSNIFSRIDVAKSSGCVSVDEIL